MTLKILLAREKKLLEINKKEHGKLNKFFLGKGPVEREKAKCFYIIIIPYLIFLILTKGFPFAWGIYMSFTNYTGFNVGKLSFVGFNNYIRVFTDNDAIPSIIRTATFSVVFVPVSMTICLMLSLMLSEKLRHLGLYRTIYYLPSIIPGVASVLIWKALFLKNGGLFNEFLSFFGAAPIDWMDFEHVRKSLMIMLLWGAGGGILTNISAIKNIPESLYEAAKIEGASYFTTTRKITLPLISNMIYMGLLNGIIGMLQLFGEPVLLSGEGGLTATPIRPIYMYMVHVYQQIFVNLRFGYGLALVFVIFIIIIIFTLLMEKTSKLWVYTESDNN